MQISDFSNNSPKINRPSREKLLLEYFTAALIFIIPTLALFVLSK